MDTYAYHDHVAHDVLALVPEDGQTIGSVGCGYATTEHELVKRGRLVHGVDVSPDVVERATSRLTSFRLVPPEQREVFEPGSLDGLILADVIEHMPDAGQRLARLADSVRVGGWVVISVPNMLHLLAVQQYLIRADWPESPTGIFDRTHLQFMTDRRLVRWCDAAGLDIETWQNTYDNRRPRWKPIIRAIEVLSLNRAMRYTTYQLQVRCRRR